MFALRRTNGAALSADIGAALERIVRPRTCERYNPKHQPRCGTVGCKLQRVRAIHNTARTDSTKTSEKCNDDTKNCARGHYLPEVQPPKMTKQEIKWDTR